MIADIFFLLHKIGIIVITFGWILDKRVLLFQVPVIISWFLNKNKCLISQLEYYYFKRTFIGNGPSYYVPLRHRYFLYFNFIVGCYFYKFKLLSYIS